MRSVIISVLAAVAICLPLATSGRADTIPAGHVGFAGFAPAIANTGNVNTATAFTLSSWTSLFGDGDFAGMPGQSFGNVPFNITMPNSLNFGNSVFGMFRSISITAKPSAAGFLNIAVAGLWMPSAQGGVTGGPFVSRLDITFSQVGGPGTPIATTGTFVIPHIVPEPPGIVLGLTGLAAGVVVYGFRRRRRATFAIA